MRKVDSAQRLLLRYLRNFHTWLMTLPWQIPLLVGAGVAMNVASDLGNTFGAAPRFGGPWVAWATLLAFLAFFGLALLAVGENAFVRRLLSRFHLPQRWRAWVLYPLLLLVVWTAVQSIVVIIHMPRTLASSQHYGSDEMYYAQYNAWLVLHGQNPYVGDHLAEALTFFHVDNVTLLRVTPYLDPLLPPNAAQTQALVAAYIAHPQAPHPQLEPATTHSYPALSFLIAVPSVWAGLPTLGYAQVAGLLALILIMIAITSPSWRVAVAALCLLDVDGIRSVAGSDFAIWTAAGMGLVWILGSSAITRPTKIFPRMNHLSGILAAMTLGAVCSVQQTAWFFAPFYLIYVWRKRGLLAAIKEGTVAVGTFLLINLPWIVMSPGPWLHSLWLPMTLPLFPTGGGIVGLGLGGAFPLWTPTLYTALELLAFAILLGVYARWWHIIRFAGLLLPMLPILFAWRSPSRYFILLPLLAVLAVVLTWRTAHPAPTPARPPAAA